MRKRTVKILEKALEHLYETSVDDASDIADACRDKELPVSDEFRRKIADKYVEDLNTVVMLGQFEV